MIGNKDNVPPKFNPSSVLHINNSGNKLKEIMVWDNIFGSQQPIYITYTTIILP